ncbi:DUF1062 domain-containing protein [Phreatobacter sp. AB_2022a]|uniref:DUF1062 domain-containing protein n=1 Tax=Phreatobacter sp. AB_2022a TaxID=3003134 RepID=UPI0022875D59|nr:DUF1062 domain-containing protein [Phreatobacter sp. AB_2022a]MCZ0734987.1 DUF1062 domain-containing protein [Phreatobacter sp. AB_2022a]
MCHAREVRWTVIPRTAPRPWIACGGCGSATPFQSSGKIRLNANGRRLDAWLIYKCLACDRTWNRPIFERRGIRDIDPAVLAALQSNDPDWIRAETFNLDALRRRSARIEEFPDVVVTKDPPQEAPGWTRLTIELVVPLPVSTRLDRLLASELKISRARLKALHDAGALTTSCGRAGALRRRIGTGTRVTIDLAGETGRERSWRPLATGDGP